MVWLTIQISQITTLLVGTSEVNLVHQHRWQNMGINQRLEQIITRKPCCKAVQCYYHDRLTRQNLHYMWVILSNLTRGVYISSYHHKIFTCGENWNLHDIYSTCGENWDLYDIYTTHRENWNFHDKIYPTCGWIEIFTTKFSTRGENWNFYYKIYTTCGENLDFHYIVFTTCSENWQIYTTCGKNW